MNCKYCGAPVKFYNKNRTECEYCGSELFRFENKDEINIKKDYNIEDLKVMDMCQDICKFFTYKAIITYIEPNQPLYIKRQIVESKVESFLVEFDVHKMKDNINDFYIDIISDIPQRFTEDDIKIVLQKALYEWSYLRHNRWYLAIL